MFIRFPKPKFTPTVTQYTPVISYNPVPPYRPLTPPLTPRPLTPVVTVSPTGSAPLLATLAADPDRFSTLVAAVTAANITQDTVDTIAPATIFAPTNAAFAKVKQYIYLISKIFTFGRCQYGFLQLLQVRFKAFTSSRLTTTP